MSWDGHLIYAHILLMLQVLVDAILPTLKVRPNKIVRTVVMRHATHESVCATCRQVIYSWSSMKLGVDTSLQLVCSRRTLSDNNIRCRPLPLLFSIGVSGQGPDPCRGDVRTRLL